MMQNYLNKAEWIMSGNVWNVKTGNLKKPLEN